jgi:TolB protein
MKIVSLIIRLAARWIVIGAVLVGAAWYFGKWQPSTEIAYLCNLHYQQLCLIDADRGIRFQLASDLEYLAFDAAWSPDGEQIVFTGWKQRFGYGIYTMHLPEQQTHAVVGGDGGAPAWSPDGQQIIYTIYTLKTTEIHAIAPGNAPHLLTTYDFYLFNPAWSPDGRQIAFQETRVDWRTSGIHTVQADGTDLRRITETNSVNFDPAWSPDGTQIAVARVMYGAVGIAVLDMEGRVLRRIPSLSNDYAGSPSWSPDGRRIAFDSDRWRGYWTPNPWAIYIMNADGSNVYYVAEGTNPVWRPAR